MGRLYHKLAKKATVSVLTAVLSFSWLSSVSAMVPNDPNYADQAIMFRQIAAESAWDITTGSKKVVVAFIDTGLDTWHDDLKENIWVNPHETPANNIDDDLNGYIDDINGWNFVENNNAVRPVVFDSGDDKEAVRHGTLVGGLIGAKGNNGLWGAGMAHNVSIMTLRAIRSDGTGSVKTVVEAIDYAVDNGASILSLSFMGDKFDQRVYDSLRRAYNKGVTIVSAAGNYDSETEDGDTSKRVIYPGCFDSEDGTGENWILSVGSVDDKDKLSIFSEYGKCLDVLAPGEFVFSTERYAPQYGYPNQFGGPWFGTSFSAPLVAGVAALIKSVHPDFTPKEIIQTIVSTTDQVDQLNPEYLNQLGKGRVNAGRALSVAVATPLKRGSGGMWFINGSKLNRFDTASSSVVQISNLPPGKILGFTSYSSYLEDEAAILIFRNRGYYLDVYGNNGKTRRSINIPSSGLFSDNVVVRFNGVHYYVLSWKFNSRTGKTEFRTYFTETKKIANHSVNGKIVTTDVDGAGDVHYATLSRGMLSVKNLIADKEEFSLKDVAKLYDLKAVGGKLYLLLAKGSRAVLISVAPGSNDASLKIINTDTKRNWKLKTVALGDKLYQLPFSNIKGNYVLYDEFFSEVLTLNISGLIGTVR